MSTKTSKMKPGDTYVVRSGEFKGLTAAIVDPKPFPDTDERRRKITIDVTLADGSVERTYMLPRMLDTPTPVVQRNVVPISQPSGEPGPLLVPHPQTGVPIFVPGDITDVDDPRLDPWRPDPSIVKGYISRTMPNGEKDVDFLMRFYERRENVLLVGDTQSGKTMMVQVMAVLIGRQRPSRKPLPVFTLSGSAGVTDFDLFGQPTAYTTPEGTERLVWLPGVVDLMTRAGGIGFFDEVNMMTERTTSSLHSLCDHRRAFVNRQKAVRIEHEGTEVFMPEVVEANDDLWIVGNINPGYKGTSMGEAFLNRWVHIPWGYDESVEKKLIPSAAIRLLGQALREARANRSIGTPIGTAALARMVEHVRDLGADTAAWILTGMFPPQEQPKVEAIIRDRSILMLLADEQAQAAKANEPSLPVDTQPTVPTFQPTIQY